MLPFQWTKLWEKHIIYVIVIQKKQRGKQAKTTLDLTCFSLSSSCACHIRKLTSPSWEKKAVKEMLSDNETLKKNKKTLNPVTYNPPLLSDWILHLMVMGGNTGTWKMKCSGCRLVSLHRSKFMYWLHWFLKIMVVSLHSLQFFRNLFSLY